MDMRYSRLLIASMIVLGVRSPAGAQASDDAAARLQRVLPANVAARVVSVIERARARELPAEALENRALKFAARGVDPVAIEKSVVEHEARMARAKVAIERARSGKPAGDEIEAAAEVLRKGIDEGKVGEIARSAPSGRSLAVPLYVVGGLVDRGLSSDDAIKRVADGLRARASDRDLERIPSELPSGAERGQGNRPAETGRALAETKRPGNSAGGQGNGVGGPPSGVPANGGARAKPTTPPGRGGKPETPPGKRP
jgi:hypothetical protein